MDSGIVNLLKDCLTGLFMAMIFVFALVIVGLVGVFDDSRTFTMRLFFVFCIAFWLHYLIDVFKLIRRLISVLDWESK